MSNEQAVQILIPMRNMMCDQNGCPISDAVFALDKAIEALSADRPQEWIPCSERLPEEEGNYLVTFGAFAETINGEKVIFGDIDGSASEIGYGCYERDIFWQPTAFGWYDLDTATPFDKRAIKAWMPLPQPWKGAADGRIAD